jgi:phosphoglycerate dehydrogenase-like enzyme
MHLVRPLLQVTGTGVAMSSRPVAFVTASGSLAETVFPAPVRAELESFAEARYNDLGRRPDEAELIARLRDVDACITTWGAPDFTPAVLAAAPRLKVIAHGAGSIRGFVCPEAFARGIVVTNAAGVIAHYVGEMALTLTLACLRDIPNYSRALKEDRAWGASVAGPPDTLFGQRVGLIGFGSTGREFARLLPPFGVELLCYDPFVVPERMAAYGARPATLEEILTTCRVISLHAAQLPSTRGLLSAERLRTIPDGTVLVNTARGSIVDLEALTAELATGRLRAALDVFDPLEPLPPDHPLRDLPNVILTPHVSGPVPSAYHEMGRKVVQDTRMVLSGQTPPDAITREQYERMA